jgi:hypothetical protein
MSLLLKPTMAVFSLFIGLAVLDNSVLNFDPPTRSNLSANKPAAAKIQVAILLDVSSSMDGLIEQAKSQLWNMVNVLGKAKCNEATPQVEIALYEYGRDQNDPAKGYVKNLSPFTTDLDALSQELFKLKTNGGQEYCGQVILTSLDELKWEDNPANYRVIFIAGNEDFLQGSVTYTRACEQAQKKGVIVNTIYCGDKMQGIREHWNLSGECGNGSYTNINQNATIQDPPTPYDSTLIVLSTKLNSTYIGYGSAAAENSRRQGELDLMSGKVAGVAVQRSVAKANSKVYNNASWDLVDATKADESAVFKLKKEQLPDSLKNKTPEQIKVIVAQKSKERGLIQEQITSNNTKREAYLVEKRKENATANVQTLQTEVEQTIRSQAKRFNIVIQ